MSDTEIQESTAPKTPEKKSYEDKGEKKPYEKKPYENQGENKRFKSNKNFYRKKVCRFCEHKLDLDYKKVEALQRFISDRGKLLPRRITGTCAKHQRALTTEIKRARILALLPFMTR